MNQSLDAMLIIELIIFVVVKRITEVKKMNRKPRNKDDWYNGMDTGNLVGMVFVDLKKGFRHCRSSKSV